MKGEELRRRRLDLGMNQSQLARALGVPVQTLTRWERGVLNIRHAQLLALALEALQVRREREGTDDGAAHGTD